MLEKKSLYEHLHTYRKRWNFINETRGSIETSPSIKSLKTSFGDLITDENRIANFLNYKFSRLGSYFGPSRPYSNNLSAIKHQPEFSFQPISKYTCIKTIKALKVNKPLGPSCILVWALKDYCPVIAEHLTILINAFTFERRFPRHLKLAHITPIHKKGDEQDPLNYRPISITSALSKIFEKVLQMQML